MKTLVGTGGSRHKNACTYATFSPSGERMLSCDAGGRLNLWEMRTGSVLGR